MEVCVEERLLPHSTRKQRNDKPRRQVVDSVKGGIEVKKTER